jgi:hypothetical protein
VKKNVGITFWAESTLASITMSLVVLTAIWHDWIEGIFGFDPDRHNGSFEWELVGVCCVVTIVFATLARREWIRAASATSS